MTVPSCSCAIDMQCVVLAGGLGRRMRPATERLPKCLLTVAGRPFVDWQLAWLAAEQVDRVTFSLGYRGDLVRRHVGDGQRFGLEVNYVDEGDHLLGTAGALRLSADQGMLAPTFFALYGDSYLPVHLRAVEAGYAARNLPVLMTVYRDPRGLERPNAVFEDGLVTRYEKGLAHPPAEMRFVDYGLSIWRRQVIETMVPSGAVADMATLFSVLSRSGQLAGYEANERFYEIGSPDGLRDLEARLLTGGDLGNHGMPFRGGRSSSGR
jgi:NDP-sugar pyrophosphorylase family protein